MKSRIEMLDEVTLKLQKGTCRTFDDALSYCSQERIIAIVRMAMDKYAQQEIKRAKQ